MTNAEWKAILGNMPPWGSLASKFINEDMDDKKWEENTNFSTFNPSVGEVSGAAGSKETTRELVDSDQKGWVKTLNKTAPITEGLYQIGATTAATALGGPALGQGMNSLFSAADKAEEDLEKQNMTEDPDLNLPSNMNYDRASDELLYKAPEEDNSMNEDPVLNQEQIMESINKDPVNTDFSPSVDSPMISELFKNTILTF